MTPVSAAPIAQRAHSGDPARPHPSSSADAPELVALFRRCFAPVRETFQPRSVRRWRWKYGYDNGGSESMIAREPQTQRIAAHCGGIPYATRCEGRVRRSVQAVDHMVDPELRRGLHRGRLFVDVMDAWIEAYCGPEKSFLGWGFPARCDFRVGTHYLDYAALDPVDVLVAEDLQRTRALRPGWRIEDAECAADSELDELWTRSRRDLPMTLERDASYLRWRYLAHPSRTYHARIVRDARANLRGLSVSRSGGLSAETATLLEWVVPDEDEDAAKVLLGDATSFARGAGLSALAIWIAPWRSTRSRWLELGFHPHRTELRHTARSWDPRVPLDDVRAGFAWSLGDVDFL